MNKLIDQLKKQVAAQPDSDALRSRDQRVSFAELIPVVEQAMTQLRSLQLQSIGLYLDNGIDWIVFDLAALAAGIKVVPLPRFFSDAQISHAISDARLDGIVFDQGLPAGAIGSGIALPGFSDSRVQRIEIQAPQPLLALSTAAKVSYTSGSTGAPKGIELDADFIGQTATSLCQAIGDLDIKTHLSILPYATLLENIAGIYVPLLLGRCVHAEPSADVGLTDVLGLDPARLQACFNRVQPNSLIITPQLLDLLCQLAEGAVINPGCLVFVAVGGARVAPALLQRARNIGIPAYEGYGLTEFASVATLNTPQNDRIGSVGKPLPGVDLVLAEDGEICLARKQSAAPLQQTEYLGTGDFGSIDNEGFVHVQGRKSNLIVLANGRNIAPEWVEAELNASPLIAQSFVFSESGDQLTALLVTTASNEAIEIAISCINRDLPAYARLHQWQRLAVPFSSQQQTLTANGRLKRRQIMRQLPDLPIQARVPVPEDQKTFSLQESNPC